MRIDAITNPAMLRKLAYPLALLAVFLGGWYFGLPAKPSAAKADDTVWTCSMHPQVRQPASGPCPICSMDLIPLEPGGEGGIRELSVSPEAAALMNLRVSPVLRRAAAVDVRLFGRIAYDERNVTTTTARMGGRLDQFYIDAAGALVSRGDPIAEIYSPELFVAQQDLIKATRGLQDARRNGTPAAIQTQERLLKTARDRLRLLQLPDDQIDAIATQAEPADHVPLFAPQDGVVTERHVVEGSYVKTGDPLFAVAGLESVWLYLEAYESDLPWLHFAQEVTFTVEALPGRTFRGRIASIDPALDNLRRVVRVRVNVANSDRLLKPGMFARARLEARVAADGSVIDPGLAGKWISPMHPEIIEDEPGECPICGMALKSAEELGFIARADAEHGKPLLVPASAALRTGSRAVVYVRLKASPEPLFEGREIVLGPKVGDHYVVDSGLAEGEMVVTRGALKLDSELQLKARPSMMNRDAGLVETPAAEAEPGLVGQWGPVPRALERLRAAAEADDAAASTAALDTIEAAVQSVNTGVLHPKTQTLWREFSVRLRNAVALARRYTPDELPLAFRDVRRAVEEAGRMLGLPYQGSAPAVGIDGSELELLGRTVDAYLAVSTALAADDEDAALAAAGELAEQLGEQGSALASSRNIEDLRAALRPLSTALIARVRGGGVDRLGRLYVVHCPMVKDYEGGDWLSREPLVRNPYFGAEMLDCGVVTENLSFAIDE